MVPDPVLQQRRLNCRPVQLRQKARFQPAGRRLRYNGNGQSRIFGGPTREGGFLYDRDSLADELPYWVRTEHGPFGGLIKLLEHDGVWFCRGIDVAKHWRT
jgi:hypothetical protein